MIVVPGGNHGYLPPEIYQQKGKAYLEHAFKCDAFALGSAIYFFKYGKNMLDYMESNDNIKTSNSIIEQIEKKIDKIKSDKSSDEGFIDFYQKFLIMPIIFLNNIFYFFFIPIKPFIS